MNCDGTLINYFWKVGHKGLVRGDSGRFILGFSIKLGVSSIPCLELYGIFHGIKLARSVGFDQVVIESDSSMTIQFTVNTFG